MNKFHKGTKNISSNVISDHDPQTLWQKDKDHHLHPWQHFDSFKEEGALLIAEGDGCYVYDTNGKRYLDAMGGLWCNNIGMGPMGFVGKSMVIDCNIEVGYCHTGGMQMSVHAFCLSSRRAVARIYGDGRVTYRTDPAWFTDYQRRETVEWPQG